MVRRYQPDGGRYTRPRRGFRAKSRYRERLRKRGLAPTDVRMETLDALRKRQGNVSGPTDSPNSSQRANEGLRGTYASV